MNNTQLIITAVRCLAHNKLRSLLTTLGIIIGVMAIITVTSIGQGAKICIKKQIETLGINAIILIGRAPKTLAQNCSNQAFPTIKKKDLQAIKNECDQVYLLSPEISVSVKCEYQNKNWQTSAVGVTQDYFIIRKWNLEKGNLFTSQDNITNARVLLIGKTVANKLFEHKDPIGKKIRINKIPFEVIGVLEGKSKNTDGRNQDDILFAPLTTIQHKINRTRNYSSVLISAYNKDKISKAVSQVRSVLRQQHNLRSIDKDDFSIFTKEDIARISGATMTTFDLFLLIIAFISLIVGGIGIMNIMLVSVAQRTREIGIRMAIGAKRSNILIQFILEAIVICWFGGLIGVSIGVCTAKFLGLILGWPIAIASSSIIISLLSTTLIGLFFGYFPAYKAAQLNPIDALIER